MDHCLLLAIWALKHIVNLGFQPCKLPSWPQTCLDGNYHSKDLSSHYKDIYPTGGCSAGKAPTLPKARGTHRSWGGGSTFVGCRCPWVVLVYKGRHRGQHD